MPTLTAPLTATPYQPTYRGLACYPFKIDGALHFFLGTFASAMQLARETAQELGATRVEVVV